jgi:hypothetical protein
MFATGFKQLHFGEPKCDSSAYEHEGRQQVFRCPWSAQVDNEGKHPEKAVKCPAWLKQLVFQIDGNETFTSCFDDLADILGIEPPAAIPPRILCFRGDETNPRNDETMFR